MSGKFADQIKIHDITLRDGEQQTGVVFTKDDKVRIAEALAEAGIHRIEAGMPAVLSRVTGARGRGRKMGVYSTFQFLGAFLGGVAKGYAVDRAVAPHAGTADGQHAARAPPGFGAPDRILD